MLKFALRRLATGLLMLLVVCSLSFWLLWLGSDTVARSILGAAAAQSDIIRFNQTHGLNLPFFTQYWDWIKAAVHGNFGMPWSTAQPVATAVKARLTVTLTLVGLATLFSAIFSMVFGILAALKRGWIDRVVQLFGLLGFAIPNFVIALTMVSLFAVKIHIFQAVGYYPASQGIVNFLRSGTLPIFALFFTSLAGVTQQVRGAMIDTLENDYIRTLRTRGLGFRRVVYKHALRNAAGPALTVLGLQFIGLLGGAIIIEQIFNIPGIGPFTDQAVLAHDSPAVMGIVASTALIVVVVNLLFDLISASLNPKVRLS